MSEQSKSKGRKIEGYWDCPQCGKKKIRGRYRYCDSCGRPRGNGVKFYMLDRTYAENQDEISDEPDWYCSFCQSLNSAKSKVCESCGSSQADSDKNYFAMLAEDEKKKREERQAAYNNPEPDYKEYNSNHSDEDYKNTFTSNETKEPEKTNLFQNIGNKFKGLLFVIPILFLIALMVNFFIPKEQSLVVTETNWERVIEIQEYKTVKESDWSVPNGGRLYDTRSEIHHYDQVVDHYETVEEQKSEQYISGYESVVTGTRDLGNGYFEEITENRPVYSTRYWTETHEEPVYKSVPVYQTKYYYEIERWVHKENEKTNELNNEDYWAEISLKENEREGVKKETYKIITENNKKKTKEYQLDYSDWEKLKAGDEIKAKISAGNIKEILEINNHKN